MRNWAHLGYQRYLSSLQASGAVWEMAATDLGYALFSNKRTPGGCGKAGVTYTKILVISRHKASPKAPNPGDTGGKLPLSEKR